MHGFLDHLETLGFKILSNWLIEFYINIISFYAWSAFDAGGFVGTSSSAINNGKAPIITLKKNIVFGLFQKIKRQIPNLNSL